MSSTEKKEPKVKQVIVIRRDLKMRRGKEIAQGSHASMAFLTNRLLATYDEMSETVHRGYLSEAEQLWLDGKFTKVCCRLDSEAEMLILHERALAAGLESQVIWDAGLTEFNGETTLTAMAIGPDWDYNLDPVTGELELY